MKKAEISQRGLSKKGYPADKIFMKIDMNMLQPKLTEEPSVPAATSKNGTSDTSKTFQTNGVFLDHAQDTILSGDRTKKKSVAEQAEGMELLGPETHMDQMIVVAQTMSLEDAKMLSEEGYDISEMDPQDAVNSLDRMKIKLAEAGVNVAGYTDTVSADKVAEVTGRTVSSADMADPPVRKEVPSYTLGENEALKENSSSTDPLSEYFMPDTTEEEIALTLSEYDLPSSQENINSVKEAINMASELQTVTENTRMFLVSEELEPTIENLFVAEFSSAKNQADRGARYITNEMGYVGKAGEKTAFEGIGDQIKDIVSDAGYGTDEEVVQDAISMVENNVPLTKESLRLYEDSKNIDIRPSKKEVMGALSKGDAAKKAYLISDYNNIKAERVMKETALSMSTDVNRRFMDKDVQLDTSYLEKDVRSLKAKEKEVFDLLEETMHVKSDILKAPVDILGDTVISDAFEAMSMTAAKQQEITAGVSIEAGEGITLRDIQERIPDHAKKYEAAGRTYEAVGTEVRADLGDSIRKAFANTDFKGILEDNKVADTPINQRAVRIISNDHLELTKDNIEKIAGADEKLTAVLDKLTPGRVLRMIRDNINPLDTDINRLNEKLTEYEDMEDKPVEDFARYLVSESRKGNIEDAEAASYIGIYRLINAINAGDHSVVGTVLASGMEMNFKNLLSAVRTSKKAHVDHFIDENFGGMELIGADRTERIDSMIRTAFSSEDYKEEYYKEEAKSFADAAKADAEIFRMLEQADIPQSAKNVNAYEQLMYQGGNAFIRQLIGETDDRSKERLRENRERVFEAMEDGDPEKVKEAYDEMVESELIGAFEGERLDIRALQSREKVINIKKALSETENFHIPTEFNGEIININLQLRHGENRNSVDIYFETETFGAVHMGLWAGELVEGNIECEKVQGNDYFKEKADNIKAALENVSGKEVNLKIGDRERTDDHTAMDGIENTGNAELYRMAKAALDAMLTL